MAGVDVIYNDEFATTKPNEPFETSDYPIYGNRRNKEKLIKYIIGENIDYVLIGDNRVAIHYFFQLYKLKKRGIRVGVIFHSLNIGQTFRNRITDFLTSIATICANDLIYVSKYTQECWCKYLIPRISYKKGIVLYNAVQSVDSVNNIVKTEKPTIVYVGRLSPEKRPDVFCEIAKSFSFKYDFVMWGSGPLYDELYQKYNKYVCFKGYEKDIKKIYDKASLIVVPSVFENCPMCILESMIRGIPSISTKVGGIPEIVTSGVNGEFLEIEDYINSFEICAKRIVDNYKYYQSNCLKVSQKFTMEIQSSAWAILLNR